MNITTLKTKWQYMYHCNNRLFFFWIFIMYRRVNPDWERFKQGKASTIRLHSHKIHD